jgi:hypothetical protein
VLSDEEALDLEEIVERTNEQKIEDWNRLIEEYRAELHILDERRGDLMWFIDRLQGMIKRVR